MNFSGCLSVWGFMNIAEFEKALYRLFFEADDSTTSQFRYENGKYPGVAYSKVSTQTRRDMLKDGEISLSIVTPYGKLNVRFGINVDKKPYMLFDASTQYCNLNTRYTHRDQVLPALNHLNLMSDIFAMLDSFKGEFAGKVVEEDTRLGASS